LALGLLFVCLVTLESIAVHALFTSRVPSGNDYYSRWAGARALLVEGHDPYSLEVTREIQAVIGVDPAFEGKGGFAYPLYTIFTFWPLAYLPYEWAQAVWIVTLQWLAIAIVVVLLRVYRWQPPPWGAALLCLGTLLLYPVARTILLGQFTLHVTLFLALTLWALQAKHDVLAGVFLAASSIKPQLIILVGPGLVLWAIVRHRWRFLAGLAAGGITLVAGAMLLFPRWPISFLEDVLRYSQVAGGRNPLTVLLDLLWSGAPVGVRYALATLLIATMLASWWRARDDSNNSFYQALYWTIIVSTIVPFQTGTTNQVILLIPIFGWLRVASQRKWRTATAVGVCGLELALWLTFLLTLHGAWEDPVMFLPLPLICLVVLLASEVRRWQERRRLLVLARSESRQ
jgi:hypothetical protein